MLDKCIYINKVHSDNFICDECDLYLNTCIPIFTTNDGYSACSEDNKGTGLLTHIREF